MNAVEPTFFRPDLHEAKDLRYLLKRLPKSLRIRWLRLCCLKVTESIKGMRLDVIDSNGEVKDILADFWSICGSNGLTLEWATGLAEYMVAKKDIREKFSEPSSH